MTALLFHLLEFLYVFSILNREVRHSEVPHG